MDDGWHKISWRSYHVLVVYPPPNIFYQAKEIAEI
jgi:hypothetical protein